MIVEVVKFKRGSRWNWVGSISEDECKIMFILIRGRKIFFLIIIVVEIYKLDDWSNKIYEMVFKFIIYFV